MDPKTVVAEKRERADPARDNFNANIVLMHKNR
jgi:hypothetical protein